MAIWIMPDGTRWDIPDSDTQRPTLRTAGTWRTMTMPSGERLFVRESATPASLAAPPGFREFLRQIASRGGHSRAARHSRRQLAAWGRERGSKKLPTTASAPATEQERIGPLILNGAEFRQHLLQQAIPPTRNDYLSAIGRKGAQVRAARYSSEQRREWARLGGMAKAAKKKKVLDPARAH